MPKNVFTVAEIALIVGLLLAVLYFGGVFDFKPAPQPATGLPPQKSALAQTVTPPPTATTPPQRTPTQTFIAPYVTRSSTALPTPLSPPRSQPSGQIVFVSSRDGNQEIYVLEADGRGQPINLTRHPATDLKPTWSPDGQSIAFFSTRSGALDLYVMERDGTHVIQLTQTRSTTILYEPFALWSSDGQELLVVRRSLGADLGRPDSLALELVKSDGSGATTLFEASGLSLRPSWSPDGQYFYIYLLEQGSLHQVFNLFVGRLSGTRYTFERGADSLMSDTYLWLPDASRLAFEDENHEIVTITPDGFGRKLLTDTSDYLFLQPISWSPDGQYLLYATNSRNSGGVLHAVRADGLAGIDFDDSVRPKGYESLAGVDWSPDSQWLTYAVEGNLFIVNIFDNAHPIQLTFSGADTNPQWGIQLP